MKVCKKERPLLLAVAAITAAAAVGSTFFTATPAVYANDLTEEDIASLQIPNVKKVTICHIPPGEPENRHTITIGAPAVAAHVRDHGDYIGACQPVRP